MKISYAITVCNEFVEIQKLVNLLLEIKRVQDEVVVLYDSKNGDKEITAETLFPIWSMSKVVTTIGILQLIEKGLINLNDPVSKYIPSFSNLDCMFLDPNDPKIDGYGRNDSRIYKCKNEMKIIHLMSHRSGFATPENFYVDALRADNLEELMEIISSEPLHYEPGTKYLYGINQSILGRVAELSLIHI